MLLSEWLIRLIGPSKSCKSSKSFSWFVSYAIYLSIAFGMVQTNFVILKDSARRLVAVSLLAIRLVVRVIVRLPNHDDSLCTFTRSA